MLDSELHSSQDAACPLVHSIGNSLNRWDAIKRPGSGLAKNPDFPYVCTRVIPKIQALESAKAKVALLESQIAKGLQSALASLPDDYGFETVDAFIQAVKNAAGVKRGRKPGGAPNAKVVKKGKRTKITHAIRSKVKKQVKAGKTGAQIANALKIPLPSVQNIKKAAGLVRAAKKITRKGKAPLKYALTAKVRKKRAAPKKASPPPAHPGTAVAPV